MADHPNKSELWGEIGVDGISKERKAELRKKVIRNDRLYIFLLVPAGLFLILGSIAWMVLGEFISAWGFGIIALGIVAWAGAAKIAVGK